MANGRRRSVSVTMATGDGQIISRDTETYNGHKRRGTVKGKNTLIDISQERARLQVSGPAMQVRLDHVSKDEALDLLHQYNDLFHDPDFNTRSLPPVKATFRSNSVSPRREKDSIVRGGYAFRSSRQGHHVFTEGISNISKSPDPLFAMKTFSIPFSNLPNSVSVHKEKHQFTLGLKDSKKGIDGPQLESFSPENLTNEIRSLVPTIDIGHSFLVSKSKKKPNQKQSVKKSKHEKLKESPRFEPSPLRFPEEKGSIHGRFSPLTPGNSFVSRKRNKKPNSTKSPKDAICENRLSVVSIGESVTPAHFNRQKRKTRKLYPMYDWQSSKNEHLRKLKFEYPEKRGDRVKSDNSSQSKVSTKVLHLEAETTIVQPINVKGKKGKKRKEKSKRKYDFLTFYTESGIIRKEKFPVIIQNGDVIIQNGDVSKHPSIVNSSLQSRASTGSSSSSHLLMNPPPSVISQSLQDEIMYIGSIEPPAELRTLKEERTLSQLYRGADPGKGDTVTNKDPVKHNVDQTSDNIQNHEPTKQPTKVSDPVIEHTKTFDKIITLQFEKDPSKIKEQKRQSPRLLSVPSISLDPLAQYHSGNENPNARPRIPAIPKPHAQSRTDTQMDTCDSSLSSRQTSVPVKNLTLYPPTQASSTSTPSISIVDEYGDQTEIMYADSARQIRNENDDDNIAEVKLNNKTLSFISPLQLQSNAKRQ